MKPEPVILVVDTHEVFHLMQPMLNHTLDRPQLVHCSDYADAMHYVASNKYADFIFADWELTGYAFMSSVRSDPENHNTPVIIMSEDRNNKRIVLDTITSEATFFLAKPFLEKGLSKKIAKAQQVLERRRRKRLHPPTRLALKVVFDNQPAASLQLVDISLDGCLLRAPLDFAAGLKIYQHAMVLLEVDEFDVRSSGAIVRIGADRPLPVNRDSVLILLRFDGENLQRRELVDLIDELGKRW